MDESHHPTRKSRAFYHDMLSVQSRRCAAGVLRKAHHRILCSAFLSSSASAPATKHLEDELEQLRTENARLRRIAGAQTTADAAGSRAGPEVSKFVGARSVYSIEPHFWEPHVESPPPQMPCFRLMDDLGAVLPGADAYVPDLTRQQALALMVTMVRVSEFDKIFLDAQRQGRISFYMTSRGEEAASVGSAAALQPADWVLPQYRELGVFFWRGLGYDDVANQLCSNKHDPAHGRQLPLHIGSPELNIMYIKSTLGTQCPHAAGAAYGTKLRREDRVAIAYVGEGTTSEGDFPSALNIAAVHGCPAIFFCRNNGYAISTGTSDQYAGDGVAPRGHAYGLPTIRIDGNDILAVIAATQRARRIGIEEKRPVLIEAMTYRVGAHSTSDDDTKYRNPEAPEVGWDSERAYWEARSPIIRFGRYLHTKGWWSAQMEEDLRAASRKQAVAALNAASQVSRPAYGTLFSDVYDEPTWMLREQEAKLKVHMEKYPLAYEEILQAARPAS